MCFAVVGKDKGERGHGPGGTWRCGGGAAHESAPYVDRGEGDVVEKVIEPLCEDLVLVVATTEYLYYYTIIVQ